MSDRTFAIGNAVHWTSRYVNGRDIRIQVHHGEIKSIDGTDAKIMPRNKKRSVRIPLAALRHKGEPSYLTDLMRKRDKEATCSH